MSSELDLSLGQATEKWAHANQLSCWYKPNTTSTNLIAKNDESEFAQIKIFVCDHQSQGRGRGQNTWIDDHQNTGQFLSSWMFTLPHTPQPILSAAIGLALWTAARSSFPVLPWSLKAPNDLYLGENKVAGILLETFNQPNLKKQDNRDWSALIIGLGMNFYCKPKEMNTATTVLEHWKKFSPSPLDEKHFSIFLDHLYLELRLALNLTFHQSAMNNFEPVLFLQDYQCKNLKFALNLFPHLQEPYLKILPNGDLQTKHKHISWSEL